MAASRMDDYRAPTAVALCGAIVLSTEQAHAVWDKYEAVFIDVLPHRRGRWDRRHRRSGVRRERKPRHGQSGSRCPGGAALDDAPVNSAAPSANAAMRAFIPRRHAAQ